MLTIIIVISIVLSFASLVMTIRFLLSTGEHAAWPAIAVALLGIVICQFFLLTDSINENIFFHDQLYIFLSFIISISLFTGLFRINKFVNETKKSQSALSDSRESLQSIISTKDKFFSIMAHDLRSPFQGIFGFINLLHEEYDSLTEEERKTLVNSISQSTRHVYKLIENLLEWSRIQTGKIENSPVKLDLKELISFSIGALKFNADSKSIKIIDLVPEALNAYCDEKMLQSIVQNLLSNAIKFTPKGGTVTCSASGKNDKIQLIISDTGVGISDEDKAKLFRLDVNFTTYGTADEKGSGFGLILIKELLNKIGGQIAIESEIKKGTSVTITIPAY